MAADGNVLERHAEALDLFGERVHAVGARQWQQPTPCTDWNVRELVNHLVVEQMWVPPLLEGRSIDEVGDAFDGDRLGSRPKAAWDKAAAAARDAFAAPGALDRTVELSYGPTPARAYCSQMIADLVVHSWDLARAIGADDRPPQSLIAFTAREMEPYAADLSGTGLFAEPRKPPPGADAWERLLARLGRQP
ncbi:TIGR03086 family protein [Streptomyces mashuensis]|uniref:TIGR03086 family protein n=1 Tax=Streptomyces mashuensis TaxID=33904 RepID=A0A919B5W3_9ACTN|nr:TIGR03086 family metal-binding protein [Streptomyces mashuensis]GHF59341.1 TIGR03086 family protein [Streptomyces mashuensis]